MRNPEKLQISRKTKSTIANLILLCISMLYIQKFLKKRTFLKINKNIYMYKHRCPPEIKTCILKIGQHTKRPVSYRFWIFFVLLFLKQTVSGQNALTLSKMCPPPPYSCTANFFFFLTDKI